MTRTHKTVFAVKHTPKGIVDFRNEPRFVEFDNRKNRKHSNVSAESLNKRHHALLPKAEIEGKSVLDLGACIGATGYWCLENGAAHYTAVEVQPLHCKHAQEILGDLYDNDRFDIIESPIEKFLEECQKQYDVVLLAGVLYAFIDVFSILKHVAKIAREIIVIDSIYPRGIQHLSDAHIDIVRSQAINSSQGNFSYVGVGSRPSPEALRLIMKHLGFEFLGLRFPEKMSSGHRDSYHETIAAHKFRFSLRFMTAFKKQAVAKADDHLYQTVSYNVQHASGDLMSFDENTLRIYPKEYLKPKTWSFEDADVIDNFQQIAVTSIPNYEIVIEKCLHIAGKKLEDRSGKIVDIGSARGYTLQKFYDAGYRNLFGIENSQGMLNKSFQQATLIYAENFPEELKNMDMIMANWVLHFIKNREEYIKKIYAALNDGGMFVLSEKIAASDDIHEMYHDFKRKNGLTEAQIKEKEESIKGVLIPYPLEWYLTILNSVGFRDINIIDADFSFVTLYCTK